MSSPYPMLTLFAIYLWIVFKAGPKFMENRKPFKLTYVTRFYNIFQIVACLYFIIESYKDGFSFKHTWKCFDEPKYVGHVDQKMMYYYSLLWWFIFLRLSEFLETIFFILRKKFNQVSILHVYHHISIPLLLWIFLIYSGGRMELYLGIINSHVHVIMYSYYFLSSFKKLQNYTKFIKPVITTIQIIQLIVCFIHSVVALLPGCHTSWLFVFQVINLGSIIFMFLKFYFENYLKNKNNSNLAKSR